MERTGVAAIIIGNEVLTAKVVDQNGPLLVRRLRERGVPLRSLHTVLDEVDAIVEAVELARRNARYVITSGGIGPTHDDVTVRAVALALGREVVRLPEMVERIRVRAGGQLREAALRLADAPAGARLLALEGDWFPVLACEELFLLPGVPELFRLQLERVLAELPGRPVVVRQLLLDATESQIAPALDGIALANPDVAIGSYPKFGRDVAYRVKVTVEHEDAARVDAIVALLQAALPAGSILEIL
jgi:molybdenum cofactor synthesis domain-containing protein